MQTLDLHRVVISTPPAVPGEVCMRTLLSPGGYSVRRGPLTANACPVST